MVFSVVFQASTGKKLSEKNHGKNYGAHKFDAKHFASVAHYFGSFCFSKVTKKEPQQRMIEFAFFISSQIKAKKHEQIWEHLANTQFY